MPIGDLLAQITGQPSPKSTDQVKTESLPAKRKPEAKLQERSEKIQKTAHLPEKKNLSKLPSDVNPKSSKIKPVSGVSLGSSESIKSTSSSKNAQKKEISSGPPKPLKKGSYAEIMARGKAAHATLGQVGKIQHKKIETQPPKRERDALKSRKSLKDPGSSSKSQKFSQAQVRDPQSKSNTGGKVTSVPEKKVKKAATATTGYAGTARPKPSNTGLNSRKSVPTSALCNSRRRNERYSGSTTSRYDYLSEEEEEEELESNYESDLSDMEAAAFEVDEEEETAAKIARREDAEALAEENRLKRQKEERRKRLAALAKSSGARS